VSHQREIWTRTGPEREELGRCISGLYLQGNEGSGIVLFGRESAIAVQEIQMHVGDKILVGLEGRHLALVTGTIVHLAPRVVKVRVTLPELRALDKCTWRLDRLELLGGMRLLKSNLLNLLVPYRKSPGSDAPQTQNLQQAARLRSLIANLSAPRFWDDDQPEILPLRKCSLDMLGTLLATCGSPEEVRYGLRRKSSFESECELDTTRAALLASYKALTLDQKSAVASVLAARSLHAHTLNETR